ncbi:glutathionylspermidine synthase family protein [Opacimonas viscosa]|uniref:Glutathionylspermidine synthase family protein n=1 Tax=Opacimonas viscosa TaxID=2961944 RepID=A0AA41X2W4_9ALTE|nr:glutathionylspermidine synthase family protein [Opacimonas viscosa]MCP3428526.1 glutathionylspermidine synthase family protein [Opacimonas viscosa]
MLRQNIAERSHWRTLAQEYGFHFHTMYGEPYWQENAYYQFTLKQIEDELETPTQELHQMCLAVVDVVARDAQWLEKFCIPESFWQPILDSWESSEPSLYSRMDFAYDGTSPAKLLENNGDTPTSLYETGFWQWLWLEDNIQSGALPRNSDQFNSLQEKLVHRFRNLKTTEQWHNIHFACCKDTAEDRGTVQYLQDCAEAAELTQHFSFIEDIGISPEGFFTDKLDRVIAQCFKLYPWEFMFAEEFGRFVPEAQVNWLEPMWKSIVSNKALLPMLWRLFPEHPNLLPAYFADEHHQTTHGKWVKKPIFSREGANISIFDETGILTESSGPYGAEGYIYQAYTPLPKFADKHTLIGSWLVDDLPAGISVREDSSEITQDMSRFLPHIILG